MEQFVRSAMRFLEGLDAQQWLFVLVGVLVLGSICLRGFGSRSSY